MVGQQHQSPQSIMQDRTAHGFSLFLLLTKAAVVFSAKTGCRGPVPCIHPRSPHSCSMESFFALLEVYTGFMHCHEVSMGFSLPSPMP